MCFWYNWVMEIKLENLSFGYIKSPLLFCGVNFVVKDKSKVLLLSEKDGGKTSFLKIVSGLDQSYFGSIYYGGKNVKELGLALTKTSLLFNPPVMKNSGKVIDELVRPFITNAEIASKKRLSRKEVKLIKNAKSSEIYEKTTQFLPNIDTNCRISKLLDNDKMKLSMLRSYLKNPENVFIDDVDKIEKDELFYKTIENKTCILTSSKEVDLGVKIDKVLYLSLGKVYEYDSLEEMKSEVVDLSAAYMFDELRKIDGIVSLTDKGYMLRVDGKNYKFTEKHLKKLEKLSIELYDESEVVLVVRENEKHVFELLDSGEAYMYDKLTKEKIF